jgi:hypothetical protein
MIYERYEFIAKQQIERTVLLQPEQNLNECSWFVHVNGQLRKNIPEFCSWVYTELDGEVNFYGQKEDWIGFTSYHDAMKFLLYWN